MKSYLLFEVALSFHAKYLDRHKWLWQRWQSCCSLHPGLIQALHGPIVDGLERVFVEAFNYTISLIGLFVLFFVPNLCLCTKLCEILLFEMFIIKLLISAYKFYFSE
jgi:hypothetical protein